MKILFVGKFIKAHSTHHYIVQEFKKKGHQVDCFDYRRVAYSNMKIQNPSYSIKLRIIFEMNMKRRIYLPKLIRKMRYYFFGNWKMNRQLLYLIKNNQYDLIILAKADCIDYENIKKFNYYSKTFYYFMDPLKIAHEMNAVNYASLTTWSSASTTAVKTLFKRAGANSYHVLEVYDEKTYYPGEENKHKEIDVIFVGRGLPNRKKNIDFLRQNNINVICHGPKWENKSIYFDELISKYRKSKIILNFPQVDSGFSDRVFHVLGTGSFLLSKYCSDLKRIFKRGVHLDWFKTPEECLKLVKYYLKNDTIRERIAQEGHKYVSENFTWKHSIEKILEIVSESN